MYITSIVFTLIAWGAGLLLDANMGLCLLRAMKENKRNGDK